MAERAITAVPLVADSQCTRRAFLRSATALTTPYAITTQSPPGLKLFVLWDMDGTSGIFTREQSWYWETGVRPEVALEARAIFTSNADALSAAALEQGATELIVCDTHHGGGNFLRDKLTADPRIKYEYRMVGLENGKRRWMHNLDRSVSGLMLPGHHAKAFTEGAFLPHTSNIEWADFRINGQSVGEIGIEACYAGHWRFTGCLTVLGAAAGNHVVSFRWVQVHANRLYELGEGGLS